MFAASAHPFVQIAVPQGRATPLGRVLPGPLDDHALLPWRFHPAMRAADGELLRV